MDKEAARVFAETAGSAPALGSTAVGPRPATPWRMAVYGVALGVVSGVTAGWALRPGGGEFAIFSELAMATVPAGVAFLVTAGLARPVVRPGGPNRAWLVSVFGWLPLVMIIGAFVGMCVTASGLFVWLWLIKKIPFLVRYFSTLLLCLLALSSAALGAVIGLRKASA